MKQIVACVTIAMLAGAAAAGLRELAAPHGLRIGSMQYALNSTNDLAYAQVSQGNFSILTIDQKMDKLQPSEGTFTFGAADGLVDYAKRNGMKVRLHVLTYHAGVPSWVLNETNTWTRARAEQILSNHITRVVQYFTNRVDYYDVVNESFWDDASWRRTLWLDGLGSSYIAQAFRWARLADTNAQLFYNDNRCEDVNPKSDKIYRFLSDLRTNGVPMHGFGTQCHVSNGWHDTGYGTVVQNFDRFGAAGMHVHITELDVRMLTNNGMSAVELYRQYSNFYHLARAAIDSTSCTAITMWDFTDEYSWIQPGGRYHPGYAWPCPWDDRMHRKPGYYGLRNAFVPVRTEFRFDETGVAATNTGASVVPAMLKNAAGTATDLHAGLYSGTSALRHDGAFNNMASSGMGTGFTGGVTEQADDNAIDALASFTLCGWYNAASVPGNDACLLANTDGSAGFALAAVAGAEAGDLRLTVDGAAVETSGGAFGQAGAWVFFAVTYDGTLSADNVRFYAGTRTTALAQVGAYTLNQGAVGSEAAGLCIGNVSARTCPFDGMLDNVRVCGANSGAAGVLSSNVLEALRAEDALWAVPLACEYRFDESGTLATNGGMTSAPLQLKNSAGSNTDLHSAAGGGVSFQIPDRAFDNTVASGMGNGFSGGRAQQPGDNNALDTWMSFTVHGWMKAAAYLQKQARLVDNGWDFALAASADPNNKDLRLVVDGVAVETAGDVFAETNEWVFFAVTYDGTRTSDNVVFYKGKHFSAVVPVATNTLNQGQTYGDSVAVCVGNDINNVYPFDGALDNVRIYGTRYDDVAVLSQADLEALRARDAVPEPAAAAMGLIGLIGLMRRRM